MNLIEIGRASESPKKFIKAVKRASRDERYELAEDVGNEGHVGPSLMAALNYLAVNDRDYLIRCNAVESLGMIGTPQAARALRKRTSDKNPTVRSYAVLNLAEIAPRSRGFLLKKLVLEKNSEVRYSLLLGLYKLGARSRFDDLLSGLGSRSFHIRSQILNGIVELELRRIEQLKLTKRLKELLHTETSAVLLKKIGEVLARHHTLTVRRRAK